MSLESRINPETLRVGDDLLALQQEIEAYLEIPVPFSPGYQFRLTGGRENLRDPDSWSPIGRTQIGQNFVVLASLPNRNQYKYVLVEPLNGGPACAVCTNDGLEHAALSNNSPLPPAEPDLDEQPIPSEQIAVPIVPRAGLTVTVETPDNLRSLSNGGRSHIQIQTGDQLTFIAPNGQNGRYQYWEVAVPGQTEHFRLCVNDTLQFGPATPTEIINQTITPDQTPTMAEITTKPNFVEAQLEVDIASLTFQSPPADQINPRLVEADGTLTQAASALRIESCIPWGVNEALIILSPHNNGNQNVPPGVPLAIERQNGTFIFSDPEMAAMARGDGRVRIEAGDRVIWDPMPAPVMTDSEVTTHNSIMAQVMHEKAAWRPRDLIPADLQNEAVCAAFVQNYLNSTLGMDFMRNSGLITPGQPTPDAWEMIRVLEDNGHAQVAADLSHFFELNSARQSIQLDDTSAEYQTALAEFVEQSRSPETELGIITFHYKHTATNARILASETSTLNSHVALNLGVGTRELKPVIQAGGNIGDHIIQTIQDRLGRSYDNSWEQNRHYLGMLTNVQILTEHGETISVNYDESLGNFVNQAGEIQTLNAGDQVQYEDIQLAHFYHNGDRPQNEASRIDGLVELLIQGNFEPVSVAQLAGLDDHISDRVDAEASQAFIIKNVAWSGSGTVTRERLNTFYQAQYQAAVEAGELSPDIDLNTYAERATTYVFNFTHSALLNLEGGGSFPPHTQLPLLNWEEKPGQRVPDVIVNPEDVVASAEVGYGRQVLNWVRGWFV